MSDASPASSGAPYVKMSVLAIFRQGTNRYHTVRIAHTVARGVIRAFVVKQAVASTAASANSLGVVDAIPALATRSVRDIQVCGSAGGRKSTNIHAALPATLGDAGLCRSEVSKLRT